MSCNEDCLNCKRTVCLYDYDEELKHMRREDDKRFQKRGTKQSGIPHYTLLPTKNGYEYFVSLPVKVINGVVSNAREV